MNAQTQQAIQTFYAANQTAVDALGAAIGVPGIWFVCLFYNESGLNPAASNSIGAVGLNQMLPSTLAQYNVQPADYQNGSVAYQCSIMQQFFAPVAGLVKRAGDLYLYNFWPAAIIQNYSASTPIGIKDGTGTLDGISQATIYTQNASLDFNNDGIIDRQDFWDGFEAKYDTILDSAAPTLGYTGNDLVIDFETNWFTWVIVAMVVMIALYYLYNQKFR